LDSGANIYKPSPNEGPLKQGEILSNLFQVLLAVDTLQSSVDTQAIDRIHHQFVIILTQDCDLEWDFRDFRYPSESRSPKRNKEVPNTLLCEVATAHELRQRAQHLRKSELWTAVERNNSERYHFLQKVEPPHDALGHGLPELTLDFKRYFTVPTAELYARIALPDSEQQCQRRAVLQSPYLEHLGSRFTYFLSRIALPEPHTSEWPDE
jgi:hypothetical protein